MNILRPSIYVIALTSFAMSGLNAQTTATTDPVGFVTVSIKGKGISPAAYSLVQFPMMKASSFQGAATAGDSTGTLNVEGTLTPGEFDASIGANAGPNYFLEVVSEGSSEGLIADINTNTATSVTVHPEDAAAISAAMPATIVIRQHTKVSEVFGSGASLLLQGGSTVSNSDIIYFGRGGALAGYYWRTGIGAGWKTLSGAAANNIPIYPGESVLVKRIGAADVSIVNAGSVQTGRALVPVSQGSVTAATSFPVGTTLATSNLLASGLTGASSAASADILYIPNADGNLISYFYRTGIGQGFKFVAGGADANNVPISDVGGVLITRRSATPFNWIINQPYANN
jgi:hypothetical protein